MADWTTDGLGNIIIWTTDNEIQKWVFDPAQLQNQPQIFKYSDKKLGHIKSVDATNPFSILVFYDDFQQIVLLDRSLARVQGFDLASVGVQQASMVAMSEQGDFWLFDVATNELRKLQRQSNALVSARTLVFNLPNSAAVTQILARENQVYLAVPQLGIYTFDGFGKFLRKFDIKNLKNIQFIDKQLIYKQESDFFKFHTVSLAMIPIVALPDEAKTADQIRLERGRLFAQKGQKMWFFSF